MIADFGLRIAEWADRRSELGAAIPQSAVRNPQSAFREATNGR
jgi:hypothetical protein